MQGITEWLPVSSSGHLVILRETMGIEAPLFFDAMVHLGTMMVVVWIFRTEVFRVLRALMDLVRDLVHGVPLTQALREEDHYFAWLLVLGTIPTTIIGLGFRKPIEDLYTNLFVVGTALLVTGTLLFLTRRIAPARRHGIREMRARDALLIGTLQGIAILPGISRSGSTISCGMFLGMNRELVTRYSFLLFIPAILGAAVIQTHAVLTSGEEIHWVPTLMGTLTAMGVGYFVIHLLLRIIRERKFHLFSYYCWAVGMAVLVYALS